MIFSKLFKPKWQNKDANVRIAAINDELNISDSEQKQILQSLLEKDESEIVRRAILLKINSFDTWLNASKLNSNNKIRDYANKQVLQIINNQHDIKLSEQEKLTFLSNAAQNSLLEDWLKVEPVSSIIIALLEKLAKPQLMLSKFIQTNERDVQAYVAEKTADKATLEKLLKKSKFDDVTQVIKDKLAIIELRAEMPIKVQKQAQLVLSKLLALKDISDYQQVIDKKAALLNEWSAVLPDINEYLPEQINSLTEKYDSICEQLAKLFVQKAEAYEQQQIAQRLASQKAEFISALDKKLEDISQSLATSIFESDEIDQPAYNAKLIELQKAVEESVLNGEEKSRYKKAISVQQKRLTQLPLIAESVTEATHLISKMSQLALPKNLDELNERQPVYQSWLKQWQVVEKNAEGVIPDSIMNAFNEINQTWHQGLKSLVVEQKQLFSQVQKKIAELKRLIASGKYNASFGVFKKINSLVTKLSQAQMTRLQRDLDNLTEKMSELSDWEHYIATPRKQLLVKDIEQLVEQPLDNPNEQANKVKEFRKVWNSLGHADDEVDKLLNEQFNQLCETAFAPCRQFYAEQEKLREQHLKLRESIIIEARTLVTVLENEQVDWKKIDGELNKLHHKWQGAGEVDRGKYKALYAEYTDVLKPLKSAIRDFHFENIAKKNDLITQARVELENDDIYAAIQNVKALQEQWRSVGYAGPKEENKLWSRFREINDQLFTKRDLAKTEAQNQQLAQKVVFEQKLVTLQDQLNDANELKSLALLINDAESLHSQVVENKPVIKPVVIAVESLIKTIKNKRSDINNDKVKQDWRCLFAALENIVEQGLAQDTIEQLDAYQKLSPFWQKKLLELTAKSNIVDRSQKTLELEILAGVESPQDLVNERLKVQVSLMQEQMQSGTDIDLQAHFVDWMQLGQLSQDDIALIERIKPIFC